jgi:PAS domain S-box-containing protein
MIANKHILDHRRQARTILIGGIFVALLSLFFGISSLSRFQAAEVAWENHNARATAIADALAGFNRYTGYGGFIHDFKNLVLRRDLPRYQEKIEANIAGFRVQLDRLEALLKLEEDKAAIAQVRATFEEYASKYAYVPPLVAAGANSDEIDAVVKVSDGPALKALAQLNARVAARAAEAEQQARQTHGDALRFAWIGGTLVIATIIMAALAMMMFLHRIVAAHEIIRKTRAQLDVLLDTAPDAMLSVARNGRIVRANLMAEHLFGYTNAELLSMPVEQLIPDRFRAAHPGLREGYFGGATHRPMGQGLSLVALTKDGREPNVEISLSHSGEDTEWLATITVRDVTEREENQRALQAAHLSAEAALTRQQEMQGELVQAEKLAALGGLVAGVAHEINTPVGVTLSAATHLEAETQKADRAYQAGELTEEGLTEYFATARQAAQLMTLNSQRAADLIQGFKQVAVDQTGGEQRVFDLSTYIDEVLLSLRPRLKKSRIEVTVDCPAELTLDSLPGALSQVLTNLIMNSLVHAFEANQLGHIHITASLENGDQVRIVYGDDGRGIPPELHAKVFEPFFTTRRSSGGSGLGLHIVHTIVTQSLKGSLTLVSHPGQGTEFTLRLPRTLRLAAT